MVKCLISLQNQEENCLFNMRFIKQVVNHLTSALKPEYCLQKMTQFRLLSYILELFLIYIHDFYYTTSEDIITRYHNPSNNTSDPLSLVAALRFLDACAGDF